MLLKQEIIELEERIKIKRKTYNEYQIIKTAAFECTNNSQLESQLCTKVESILMYATQKEINDLTNKMFLLGLDLKTPSLTCVEKTKLNNVLTRELVERFQSIVKELQEMGVSIENTSIARSCLSLSSQENCHIELQQELIVKQELHVQLLKQLVGVLNDIIDLQRNTCEVIPNQIHMYTVTSHILECKMKIMKAKLKISLLTETPNSLEAFHECLSGISTEKIKFKQEIEKLQDLKEKYSAVSSKEYDEILNNYCSYKSKIQKRQLNDHA